MSGHTTYMIACACGREVSVGPAAAGRRVPCACGGTVQVPRLSELRATAGDVRSRLPAVTSINYLLMAGELPASTTCALSGVPTADAVEIILWRNVPVLPPTRSGWWTLALNSVFVALPVLTLPVLGYQAVAEAATSEVVPQTVACVPLRVDRQYHAALLQFDYGRLAMLLRTEPLYARLLDENPGVFISIGDSYFGS